MNAVRKCPRCRGNMLFDPREGKLRCSSCDRLEDVISENEEETNGEEQDFFCAERKENYDWGVEKKTVRCQNCGIEMVYDAEDVWENCPYCMSSRVTEEETDSGLAPDGICVFKLDAKQAAEHLEAWIRRRWFCPKEVKQNIQPKNFKGIYVPCWTFDTNADVTYDAYYGIHQSMRGLKDTCWEWCNGTYHEFVDDQLVDGRARCERDLLNTRVELHTKENKAYRPEYLAGFAVERYSVALKDAWESAKELISERLERRVRNRILAEYKAEEVKELKTEMSYKRIQYKLLLLPVWVFCVEVKGKVYRFEVNGQTGKVSGKYRLHK